MKGGLLAGVAAIGLLAASGARAQIAPAEGQATVPPVPTPQSNGAPPPASSTERASASGGVTADAPASGLGDIVVTAQRVSQSSQKAAVAIDVVSGGDLLKAGVSTASRLTELAPALTVESAGTYNFFFVRGVGNFSVTSYSDPAIAFNYDGVYIGRPTSASGVFYDVDRVEVLKGPQGTLYGRNATGGAINVLPTQPKTGEFSGFATGSYGDYHAFNGQGAVNVPIGEDSALRVSGNVVDRHAYLKDGQDDEKTQAARLQFKTRPLSGLTIRISGDYSHSGGAGAGYSYVDNYVYNPALTSLPLGQRFTVAPANIPLGDGAFSPEGEAYRTSLRAGPAGRNLDAFSSLPYLNNYYYGVTGEIDYDTPIGTLTVIPAWRHSRLNDLGGIGFFVWQHEIDNQTSVEARLGKTGVGVFDYNVGFYYFDERIRTQLFLDESALAAQQQYHTGTRSYAGFGRLTAHLTDRLRLVGGVRYTQDDKRFDGQSTNLVLICAAPSCPTAPLFQVYRSLSDIPFAIPRQGVPIGPGPTPGLLVSRGDVIVNDTQDRGRATYRGAIEFDLTPRSLLYASVESGYRSGGFNLAAGYETYRPETITAYTIGSKNRFLDNRVQLNLEGFYWRYRNQQIPHIGTDLAGQQANFTQNIGRATIYGGEAEARFLATRNTLLSADVQYLHTNYSSFDYLAPAGRGTPPYTTCAVTPASNPAFFNVDCSGKPAYNSPKWTINLAGQQTFEVGPSYKIVLGADTQYRGAHYIGFEYRPSQHVGGEWRTNLFASFGDARDRWSVSGFIRNVEGKRTPTFAAANDIGQIDVVIPSAPRTYGVQASVRF